jgi:ABC-type amino acid transport substrate-binding protein
MKGKKLIALALCVLVTFSVVACGGQRGEQGGDQSGGTAIASPDDFAGRNIAVQTATTAADYIDAMIENGAKNIEVSRYEKVTQCFDDLLLGRVDAVLVDSVVSAYYTTGNDDFVRSWLSEEPEPMGICFAKDNSLLAAAVETAVNVMYTDGTMAEIAKKHFGEDFTAGLREIETAKVIKTGWQTKEEGVLTVGMEVGYPPMEYTTDDGLKYIGFDVDVAARVAELLGLKVEYVNTAWDGIFAGLEKGEYDCIMSSVSITPERQEKYILSQPYVANKLCIVVKAES